MGAFPMSRYRGLTGRTPGTLLPRATRVSQAHLSASGFQEAASECCRGGHLHDPAPPLSAILVGERPVLRITGDPRCPSALDADLLRRHLKVCGWVGDTPRGRPLRPRPRPRPRPQRRVRLRGRVRQERAHRHLQRHTFHTRLDGTQRAALGGPAGREAAPRCLAGNRGLECDCASNPPRPPGLRSVHGMGCVRKAAMYDTYTETGARRGPRAHWERDWPRRSR